MLRMHNQERTHGTSRMPNEPNAHRVRTEPSQLDENAHRARMGPATNWLDFKANALGNHSHPSEYSNRICGAPRRPGTPSQRVSNPCWQRLPNRTHARRTGGPTRTERHHGTNRTTTFQPTPPSLYELHAHSKDKEPTQLSQPVLPTLPSTVPI